MFNIADYLKKFSKIQGSAVLSHDSISQSLKEVCRVDKAKFEAKKGILYIKGSPVERMLIFTKKAAVLAAIKSKDPLSSITDIR